MHCNWRRFIIQDVQKEMQPIEIPYGIVIRCFYFYFTCSLFQNDYDHHDLQTSDHMIYFYGDF
jgi:hypothetical protein